MAELVNGVTKEELYKDERIKRIEKHLAKLRELKLKYGDPFAGMTSVEIVKILRRN